MVGPITRRLVLAAAVVGLAPVAALAESANIKAASAPPAAAEAAKPLKVGVSAGPYGDILREAARLAEKEGLKVEVIEFTDWTQPNAALNAGDIDLNNFQHRPYLSNQVKARGFRIIPLETSIVVPAGIYSSKFAKAADIPTGARVAIPNDPSNSARSLYLFQQAGLIKLREGAGVTATVADIVDNPKNLSFIELDAAQLPRSLDDVAAAFVSNNYAHLAGLDRNKALALEGIDSQWTLVFAARDDRKDDPRIRRYIDLYRSADVKAFVDKTFGGSILATW
ncbi:MetQ/NlpA family ABC transporter substrate-binding protein [Blastochloris viridis]|uniref:Lipoprotein n=1 Tax=Blastochloris viridis TaxID=1079 RepID=A0A0H5BE89_BLAVI|nr:MetQ/NlpA family ABC transporter substrate-binding protein [Blastochloris viridis]ALK09591.1 D-methionine-binding lipoprotein MetQ precursor [Blastochloris viridis]BAS00521.1 methionine ABC transporter substrate-binding protein [Blastochloris viridis]CUU42254.1 D-methionine-binding lipoprotein metQ precursor [Blastochloris viridis]